MTEGNIWMHLILFALPLLIGNLFQQLYNTVDSIVVGNFVSKTALAAVGSTDNIINTIIGFFSGLATGAGVVISHSFGSGDKKALHRAVHTTITLTFVLSIFFTIAGLLLAPLFLKLMATPEDVLPEASAYLRIYFAGVSGLMIYNMGSGILRAVGDSRRPLYILIVCAVTNIVLDLAFVVYLGAGVEGVAYATIISQWISAILVLVILTKEQSDYRLVWKDLRIDKRTTLSILRIGFPAGLQMAITAFSNVFVQSYINQFGSSCMAGWTTYGKLDKFCLLPIQSLGLSITTFVGQNLGAKKMERARKGTAYAVILSIGAALILMMPVMATAPMLATLFTNDPEVIAYGVRFIRLMMPFYVAISFNQILGNALRGAGNSVVPMILMMSSFIVFRQIYLFAISHIYNTITSVALGYPFGWILCSVLLLIYYMKVGLTVKKEV
jgi:MATE efflux family protein